MDIYVPVEIIWGSENLVEEAFDKYAEHHPIVVELTIGDEISYAVCIKSALRI